MSEKNGKEIENGRHFKMKRDQRKAIVNIHDHIQKAYSLYMQNFSIKEGERLDRITNTDLEKMLMESKNVFDLLLKHLGEIPLELSDNLEIAYKKNDETAILEAENKIDNWK